MDLQQEKLAVRKELKAVSGHFTTEYVEAVSRAVCRKVLQSQEFLQARVIFGYLAFHHEISVDLLLQEALRMGKTVAVPCILSRTEMQAVILHTLDDLPLDRFGIRTAPEPVQIVPPETIELLLVPGAGFTLSGCRMGRGAGYYDRFLAETKGYSIGITCERLLREQIPMDRFDRKVDAVVTEVRETLIR